MPNWCMNNVTITHPKREKLQEFVDAYNSGSVCNHFVPQPKDLNEKDCFAPNGWYTWRCNNWGTKWDFGKEDGQDPIEIINNEVSFSCNTAWSPPIEFYNMLQKKKYSVHATYWEPGIGFCGVYENGVNDTIEYEDKSEIPDELWNEYGMADFFEETEADA